MIGFFYKQYCVSTFALWIIKAQRAHLKRADT